MTNAACLQAGEIIAGKFCVERIIATGGVGVVVAARHMQLGETVALKFLIPQPDRDATDVARFVREAQSAVKLKNEHVARILDVGSLEDGSPFMVMEYLEGSDLDQILRHRGPLSILDAVDYVLQASEAIAEAHRLGIVHRDIKPSNFFLTRRTDGSPLIKVLDFGIAKARAELQQDLSLTKTRAVLGSPVYMSPEQLRSARSVDHRTDIWSLGVTLYELLTDQIPFDGDSITGVAAAVSTDPIEPIRSLRPDIPVGLSRVVEKCLEKKPGDRYQNVAEFAAALVPFGSETARFSLTRIRGALNMRTRDSSADTDTLVGVQPELAPLSPDVRATASTTSARLQNIAKRPRVMVLFVALLIAGSLAAIQSLRQRPIHDSGRSATQTTSVRSEPSLSVPSADEPQPSITREATQAIRRADEQENPEPKATVQLPIVSAAVSIPKAVPPAHAPSRKPAAAGAVAIRAGAAKAPTEGTSQTKDTHNGTRYEAIFDTRK